MSIDLFGPMPDKRHVVVVQDVKTRFPCAKIVSSTAGNQVVPAIEGIYNDYGNPDTHRTDNGPPFNSSSFKKMSDTRGIQHRKVFPYHPKANPVETFMKPLGKAMKNAYQSKENKEKALTQLLTAYCSTPHPATGEAPGNLLLRGGYKTDFPRHALQESQVQKAFEQDIQLKQQRQLKANNSRFRNEFPIQEGDVVMVRNNRRNKFDPLFGPELYKVVQIKGAGLTVLRLWDKRLFNRHKDDIKKVAPEMLGNTNQEHLMSRGVSNGCYFTGDNMTVFGDERLTEQVIHAEDEQVQREDTTDGPEEDTDSSGSIRPQRVPKMLRELWDYNNPGLREIDSNVANLGSMNTSTTNVENY